MIQKHKKSNRKFIPISIAESLSNLNKKFLYKFGQLDYIIHSKWSDIVGDYFIQHSEPEKITSIFRSTNEIGEKIYDKYLHVNVAPPAALEFQHFQDKIIEKINSYFGYKAINGIKIRQQYIKKKILNNAKKNVNLIEMKKDKKIVKESTPSLTNKRLEESIFNLGLSINKEKE